MNTLCKILRRAGLVLADTLLALCLLWVLGMFAFRPESLLMLLPLAALLFAWKKYGRGLRLRRALWLAFACGLAAYQYLPAPNHVAWQAPWGKAPQFELSGDTLTIRNLRDFRYRSVDDYDVQYRTETYDLRELESVDLGECHWDGNEAICHTMLSFGFADGRHIVVSAETRLPEGVAQNALGGIYKCYGLIYVFGTENDIFGLRTDHRHEDLVLYPFKVDNAKARTLLMSYIALAEEAEAQQLPYNTVTDNCSSGLVRTFRALAPQMPARYNLLPLHNSSISKLIFEHGGMQAREGETHAGLTERCYLGYDLAKDSPDGYSAAIRDKRERGEE